MSEPDEFPRSAEVLVDATCPDLCFLESDVRLLSTLIEPQLIVVDLVARHPFQCLTEVVGFVRASFQRRRCDGEVH